MEDGDIPKEGDEEEEEVVDLGVLNDVQEQVFEARSRLSFKPTGSAWRHRHAPR